MLGLPSWPPSLSTLFASSRTPTAPGHLHWEAVAPTLQKPQVRLVSALPLALSDTTPNIVDNTVPIRLAAVVLQLADVEQPIAVEQRTATTDPADPSQLADATVTGSLPAETTAAELQQRVETTADVLQHPIGTTAAAAAMRQQALKLLATTVAELWQLAETKKMWPVGAASVDMMLLAGTIAAGWRPLVASIGMPAEPVRAQQLLQRSAKAQ